MLGEEPGRREARLEAHVVELRRRVDVMVRAQRTSEAKIARLHDQLDHDAIARAYESRDKWRDALLFVVEEHERRAGRCSCGSAWPCLTIKSLDRTNKGIARSIEETLLAKDREVSDLA